MNCLLSVFKMKSVWIFNISEIETGRSAVLGGNYITYYTLHTFGMFLISASLISNLIVITSVVRRAWNTNCAFDFSLRFPIYIAVADLLWGLTHLLDHIYLLHTGVCPEITPILGSVLIFLLTWLGYQQLMHAGLAVFMYLKLCRNISYDLGKFEWKLHFFCLTFSNLVALYSYFTGAFGCSGFWVLMNLKTTSGLILALSTTLLGIFLCIITPFSYLSVRRIVNEMHLWRQSASFASHKHNTVATQCLTMHIWISFLIYCPLTIGYVGFIVQTYGLGIIEPITIALIMFSANSGGCANAIGYYYNQRVRKANRLSRYKNNGSRGTKVNRVSTRVFIINFDDKN